MYAVVEIHDEVNRKRNRSHTNVWKKLVQLELKYENVRDRLCMYKFECMFGYTYVYVIKMMSVRMLRFTRLFVTGFVGMGTFVCVYVMSLSGKVV